MTNQVVSILESLTFEQPRVLLALALAVPLVVLAVRARLRGTSAGLRAGIFGVRLTVLALLLLSLAQPTLRPAGSGRAVVFAIDVSDSLAPDQEQWAHAWVDRAIQALPAGSRAEVVEFGARAQLAQADQVPPTSSTDLAAALRFAGALLPRDPNVAPEIVLLTDGWQTASAAASDTPP